VGQKRAEFWLKQAQPKPPSLSPPRRDFPRLPSLPKQQRCAQSKAAMATAAALSHPASMDARGWDEASYRRGILRARDLSSRTLFRAVFFENSDDPDPDVLLAAASSDGSLSSFSLSSCISAASQVRTLWQKLIFGGLTAREEA